MLISGQNHLNKENLDKRCGIDLTDLAVEQPSLLNNELPTGMFNQLRNFLYAYFTDSTFNEDTLDNFVQCSKINPGLDAIIFGSPARATYPARKRFQIKLYKRLIHKVFKNFKTQ